MGYKHSGRNGMIQEKVKVLYNQQVGPNYFKIGLACHQDYQSAKPGQFVMLHLVERKDPLLRRPFSIHNLIVKEETAHGIEVLYKVVGRGTDMLAGQQPGSFVDLLGPLGTGFLVPPDARRIYIVAGGIGVAPLVYLASRLPTHHIALGDCQVFLGGRTQDDILCENDFRRLGIPVHTTTDDGSAGDQCLVTHPLEEAVAQELPDIVYACGPMAMLGCVVGIVEKHGIPCQVSVESMMACGIGACLGCALESRKEPDRYLHTCLNGPVFDANALNI
jgi:dihydroorotate dehydrogenase electron transfer subunit